MTLDWQSFTPASALLGGAIIGISVVAFALLLGRVAGVSGILGGLLVGPRGERAWRAAFLAGLVLASSAYSLVAPLPLIEVTASYPQLIAAGLLVGFGTRLGSGCTSGHGICGLARFSLRSLVATSTFIACAFATVFVVRHVIA